MHTTDTILSAIEARFERPHSLARGTSARTEDGVPCDPCSPAARSWCLLGAIEAELGKISDQATRDRLRETVEAAMLRTAQQDAPHLYGLAQLSDDRTFFAQDARQLARDARGALGAHQAPVRVSKAFLGAVSRSLTALAACLAITLLTNLASTQPPIDWAVYTMERMAPVVQTGGAAAPTKFHTTA